MPSRASDGLTMEERDAIDAERTGRTGSSEPQTLKVGDRVTVDSPRFPGIWTIQKVNPTTYRCTQETGGAPRALRVHHDLATLVTGEASETDGLRPAPLGVPYRETLYPGAFVRFTGRTGGGLTTGDLLVVLADKGQKINCTRPGGAEGSYWRLLPRTVEVVATNEVLR